jgi:hypothetical protein
VSSTIVEISTPITQVGVSGASTVVEISNPITQVNVAEDNTTVEITETYTEVHIPSEDITVVTVAEDITEVHVSDSDGNALKIQGIPVSATAPTDEQALVYNSTTEQWEPAAQSGSGITWEEITGATTAENNKGYFANNVSRVDIALPSTATVGFQFYVCGKGAGGWRVTQSAGQTQHTDYVSSKTGTDGYIESGYYLNNALIVCMTANTDWKVFTLSNLVVNDNT